MSTSANVIEYTITKNEEQIGYFRKHLLTKYPEYSDLLKYEPLRQYEIMAYGYDEDEEYWEDEPKNLEEFLWEMRLYDQKLKEYFKNKI